VKWSTYILAFYILLLPCIPCTDVNAISDTTVTEVSRTSSEHKEQAHETETCNPFCTCACCGQIFLTYPSINNIPLEKPSHPLPKHFSDYTNSEASYFYGTIWQPPKLS
jgi:hypothetical protein